MFRLPAGSLNAGHEQRFKWLCRDQGEKVKLLVPGEAFYGGRESGFARLVCEPLRLQSEHITAGEEKFSLPVIPEGY